MSEEIITIHEKLMNVQKSLKVPKNQYNAFGKYNYRSAEDILEASKPVLRKQGLVLTVRDEIVEIGDRIYVKAIAELTDISGTGKTIINTAYAREPQTKKGMDEAQITGATSTYARKYALNGLFCLDDTKDADSMDNRQSSQQAPQQESMSNVAITGKCKDCGVSVPDWTSKFSINKFGKELCQPCQKKQ